MAEDDMERTERPTPKRLEEARKKGQVPRSSELSTAAVVLIAGAGLHFMGRSLGSGLFELMRTSLSLTRRALWECSRLRHSTPSWLARPFSDSRSSQRCSHPWRSAAGI